MMCKVKLRQARIWGRSFNSARPRLNDPRSCIRVKFLTAKNLISERSIVQAVVCHKREDEQSFKFKAWHITRSRDCAVRSPTSSLHEGPTESSMPGTHKDLWRLALSVTGHPCHFSFGPSRVIRSKSLDPNASGFIYHEVSRRAASLQDQIAPCQDACSGSDAKIQK